MIRNTIKITIFDTRKYKNLLVDSCTVFWRNGYPEMIGRVFKKRMTKRFATIICNWLDELTMAAGEQKGWEEFLKYSVVIKEYDTK